MSDKTPAWLLDEPPDVDLADKVVDYLNHLLDVDRQAISQLIESRVPCNEHMVDHPTVQVQASDSVAVVGLLGILNGLCGGTKAGCRGLIVSRYRDDEAKIVDRFFRDYKLEGPSNADNAV